MRHCYDRLHSLLLAVCRLRWRGGSRLIGSRCPALEVLRMMNANQISITGRLTRDPEARYTNSGKCICNFSIAHNRRIKVGDEWKDAPTTYLDCKAWGKYGEVVAATCKKGRTVQVTGSIETEEWERDGEKKSKMVINAVCISIILNADRPSDALDFTPSQEKPVAANTESFGGDDVNDDVPF